MGQRGFLYQRRTDASLRRYLFRKYSVSIRTSYQPLTELSISSSAHALALCAAAQALLRRPTLPSLRLPHRYVGYNVCYECYPTVVGYRVCAGVQHYGARYVIRPLRSSLHLRVCAVSVLCCCLLSAVGAASGPSARADVTPLLLVAPHVERASLGRVWALLFPV